MGPDDPWVRRDADAASGCGPDGAATAVSAGADFGPSLIPTDSTQRRTLRWIAGAPTGSASSSSHSAGSMVRAAVAAASLARNL